LVFTLNIGTDLNLTYVTRKLSYMGAQYNKKRFAAVIVRYMTPKIAYLMFRRGKMVCTGAKNPTQAYYLIHEMVQEIRNIGYKDAKVNKIETQNMVVSVKLPWMINQDQLAKSLSWYCTYEPAIFPGVTMRHPDLDPFAALIFKSVKKALLSNLKYLQYKN
jgi:transcription initiation factor TFIID TATA-box-binding protein